MRGDARRLLLSKLVVDHWLTAQDPFTVLRGGGDGVIVDRLLGDRPLTIADAAHPRNCLVWLFCSV
jgi:acyl-CoA dehydrogenase